MAAPVALDVDGEVRHVLIGGASVEDVEAAPAHHRAGRLGDDHRVTRPARGNPLAPLRRSAKLRLAGGPAVLPNLVVDQADGFDVARAGRTKGEGDGNR